jgi:hypothetical protein
MSVQSSPIAFMAGDNLLCFMTSIQNGDIVHLIHLSQMILCPSGTGKRICRLITLKDSAACLGRA